jgi:tetratricopeptide (TPR) repeat protein
MHQALLGQVKSDRARLGVLACETALRTMLGPVALALTIGEQARELAHQLGLLKEEAGIETMLGIACRYMVDTSQAIIHFERARALYKACNDTIREAYRLGDLSLCYSYIGNIKQALDYAHRLLQFAQRSQDMRATVAAHDALSLACVARGQWEEAIGHGEAVLAAWQSGMHDGKAYVLNTIGLAHFCAGRYAQAIDALRRGVIVAAELESLRAKGFCLYNLALMHYMHGNMAEVRQPAVEAQPSLSASGLAEQGTVVLALLDAVADADRTIEIRVLLTQARHLANNPDLFPARVLATHARDLAENLGLTDLAESAQQCIDDLVAKLILPDA